MAALKPNRTEVKALMKAIDGDYGSDEEAAEAILLRAWELYESASQWAVVGQVYRDSNGTYVTPDDPHADKACLMGFRTQTQAHTAALAMVYAATDHETWKTWELPTWFGTPHTFKSDRKGKREASGEETMAERMARISASATTDSVAPEGYHNMKELRNEH